MRVFNIICLSVALVTCIGTFSVCAKEGITPEILIGRFSNLVNQVIEDIAKIIDRSIQETVELFARVEVYPIVARQALVSVARAQSRAVMLHYNGFVIDTTSISVKQKWEVPIFGGSIDCLDRDIEVSLWSYASGSVPVYIDLSEFTSNDIEIDTCGENLRITLTVQDPMIGRCRIDHRNVNIDLLESDGMTNEEAHEYVSEIYLTAMSQARESIETDALNCGIVEQTRTQFSASVASAVRSIYPGAEVKVIFKQGVIFIE